MIILSVFAMDFVFKKKKKCVDFLGYISSFACDLFPVLFFHIGFGFHFKLLL